jgi:hypothetical protein
MRTAPLVIALALSATCGCAAVFRDSSVRVRVESDPQGAEIRHDDEVLGTTPAALDVERRATTDLLLTKPGYADHRGVVKKHLNAGWVVADVATCVIPVALCIPLLVDAVSGAWMDVDERYRAHLRAPAGGAGTPPAYGGPPGLGPAPAPTGTAWPPRGAPQGPGEGAPPAWPVPEPLPDGGAPPGTIQL